jgi:hypothetical protein
MAQPEGQHSENNQRHRTASHFPSKRSHAHPDRVEQLAAMWQAWAERANALPLDNRRWLERLRNQSPELKGRIKR